MSQTFTLDQIARMTGNEMLSITISTGGGNDGSRRAGVLVGVAAANGVRATMQPQGRAWSVALGGAAQKVAIVVTAFQMENPDLAGNIVTRRR